MLCSPIELFKFEGANSLAVLDMPVPGEGGGQPFIAPLPPELSSTRTGLVLSSPCEMGLDLSIYHGNSRVAPLRDSSACATPALAPGNELHGN